MKPPQLIALSLCASVGCMHTSLGTGAIPSPDGRYVLGMRTHGASAKAYNDRTQKRVYLWIDTTAKWDPMHVILGTEYIEHAFSFDASMRETEFHTLLVQLFLGKRYFDQRLLLLFHTTAPETRTWSRQMSGTRNRVSRLVRIAFARSCRSRLVGPNLLVSSVAAYLETRSARATFQVRRFWDVAAIDTANSRIAASALSKHSLCFQNFYFALLGWPASAVENEVFPPCKRDLFPFGYSAH